MKRCAPVFSAAMDDRKSKFGLDELYCLTKPADEAMK
jgi:hypothetical protein